MEEIIGEDYHLLLASVHEWVLVSASAVSYDVVIKHVKEMNETVIGPEIFLSDKVHCYNIAERRLITNKEKIPFGIEKEANEIYN